jgi:hypothetical protein
MATNSTHMPSIKYWSSIKEDNGQGQTPFASVAHAHSLQKIKIIARESSEDVAMLLRKIAWRPQLAWYFEWKGKKIIEINAKDAYGNRAKRHGRIHQREIFSIYGVSDINEVQKCTFASKLFEISSNFTRIP